MRLNGKKIFLSLSIFVWCIFVAASNADAFVLSGQKWPGSHPRIPYYVSTNLTGSVPFNGTFETAVTAIQNASNIWNTQGDSDSQFQYSGTTNISTVANDGYNVIFYDPGNCPAAGTGCSAQTFVHYSADNFVRGFDIVLYGHTSQGLAINWVASGIVGFGQWDVWSIVLHELGHTLGLGHSELQSVMGTACASGCRRQNLITDDQDGIQAIYGAYSNEGIWASNTNPVPGDTITLNLDYPKAAGQRFQIVAEFQGTPTSTPLRNAWSVDSRVFPLSRMPQTLASWDRGFLEKMALPVNSGVLDGSGHGTISVKVPAAAAALQGNLHWYFSVVTYDPAYTPSQIEDVGVAVDIMIQAPQAAGAHLLALQ